MENVIVKVDMAKLVDKKYYERIKKIITNKYNKGQPIILSKNHLSNESIHDFSKSSLTEIIESLNSTLNYVLENKYSNTPSKRDFASGSGSVFNKEFYLSCSVKNLRKSLKTIYPLMNVEKMTKEEIIDFILADTPSELL